MRNPSIATAALLACGLCAASQVLTASQALAADYPVLRGSQIEDAPPERRDMFSSAPNWGGFYVGGTAGYATGQYDPEKQSADLSRQAFRNLIVSDSGSGLLRFGKISDDKTTFGGFAGYNFQFGDAVLGLEAEYIRVNLQTDQRGSISRGFTGLFPTSIGSAPNVEPLNTQTAITVSGRSHTKIDDLGLIKARAGYAFGNFMPFATIGFAVGRIATNSNVSQTHTTVENFGRYNTITDPSGSVTRTTFIGNAAIARPDASGSGSASYVSSGYVPGFAIGGGIDALLGENILVRAEFNRIYFTEYKGVNAIVDSARIGAGLKF